MSAPQPTPRLLEVPKYDFSGIEGHEHYATPLYAAALGEPSDRDYSYVEAYADGTLRYRCTIGEEPYTYLTINPRTGRLYASDYCYDDPTRPLPFMYEVLRGAGVPEDALDATPVPGSDSLLFGDPHAGWPDDTAHRLTQTALRALQFSRFFNYDMARTPDEIIPEMTREHYAQALGAIVGRFGPAVLQDGAISLIDGHFATLHTDLHTPGLLHKTHSDGGPKGEDYMTTAGQVIRGGHALYETMRHAGRWVNFVSLFGDTDFWAVTKAGHPEVFNAAVDHILEMPDPYQQPEGMYGRGVLVSPVGLIRTHFAGAYQEIVTARPDFQSGVPEDKILTRPQRMV